jgi:broad specificity phosphatase PhoE
MVDKYAHNTYVLVRHGEAENNVLKVLNSVERGKYGLTERGKEQIRQAAEFIRSYRPDFIVASPIRRTEESTKIIAEVLSLPFSFDERLTESRFGVFEGRKVESFFEFVQTHGGRSDDMVGPDIEGYASVRERVESFLDDLNGAYDAKTVVIVSHADTLQELYAGLLGEPIGAEQGDGHWFPKKGACLVVSASGVRSFNPAVVD